MRTPFHCRAVALLMAALLLFPAIACAETAAGAKKVTVMVYMCGSNLESNGAVATRVLGEMRSTRFNRDAVNVVAMLGGSTRWWSGYDSDRLTLVHVDGSRKPPIVKEEDWASMGEPGTLSSFLDFCHANFPAERYILILWDHGGGPNEGVCYDYMVEKREHRVDTLSTLELETALKNSPFASGGLDIVAFHACLMASAEVANRVAPYARYMVASEEVNYGLGYEWLKGVENDADARETAIRMVDASYAYNQEVLESQNENLTNVFAAIDLAKLPLLSDAMDPFFGRIADALKPDDGFTTLSTARRDVAVFGSSEDGSGTDSDLADLGDLVNKYRFAQPESADSLLEAIDEVVIHRQVSTDSCAGLSVYHPFLNRYSMNTVLPAYGDLGFSMGYTAFVRQFAEILLDEPLCDWTDLKISSAVEDKAMSTQFKLALTDDQAVHLGGATLNVLQEQPDGSYRFVYASDDVRGDGGSVTGEYKNLTLYAVDKAGNPLSEALEYRRSGELYVIPAQLSREAGEVLDAEGNLKAAWEADTHDVLITCALDPVTLELAPRGVMVRDESTGLYTNALGTSFGDYQHIRLTQSSRMLPPEGTYPLPPFSDWEIASTDSWESPVDGSWRFRLLEDRLPTDGLYAIYQVCDSQNNRYSSAMLSLNALPSETDYRLDYDDKTFDIEVDSFQLTIRDDLAIPAFVMYYKPDQALYVTMENIRINDVPVEGEGEAYGTGPNGAFSIGDRVSLSAECDISALAGEEIKTMSFDVNLYDAATDEQVYSETVKLTR